MADQNEFIAQGQLLGEVGIALDGPTPIEDINVNIFDLDCILIFTADQVGFSKQQLIEDRLEKIVQIKKIREDLIVEADGGISDTTLNLAKEAGASRFCSAGFIFKDEKVEENFKKLSAL